MNNDQSPRDYGYGELCAKCSSTRASHRCYPAFGSCGLHSGHGGQHDAYAGEHLSLLDHAYVPVKQETTANAAVRQGDLAHRVEQVLAYAPLTGEQVTALAQAVEILRGVGETYSKGFQDGMEAHAKLRPAALSSVGQQTLEVAWKAFDEEWMKLYRTFEIGDPARAKLCDMSDALRERLKALRPLALQAVDQYREFYEATLEYEAAMREEHKLNLEYSTVIHSLTNSDYREREAKRQAYEKASDALMTASRRYNKARAACRAPDFESGELAEAMRHPGVAEIEQFQRNMAATAEPTATCDLCGAPAQGDNVCLWCVERADLIAMLRAVREMAAFDGPTATNYWRNQIDKTLSRCLSGHRSEL